MALAMAAESIGGGGGVAAVEGVSVLVAAVSLPGAALLVAESLQATTTNASIEQKATVNRFIINVFVVFYKNNRPPVSFV
jgi:hypothetical protein